MHFLRAVAGYTTEDHKPDENTEEELERTDINTILRKISKEMTEY